MNLEGKCGYRAHQLENEFSGAKFNFSRGFPSHGHCSALSLSFLIPLKRTRTPISRMDVRI